MEIHMQSIIDLLEDDLDDGSARSPNKFQQKGKEIREDQKNGVFVEGLTEKNLKSFEDCVRIISRAVQNRISSQTKMNKTSSRSHAILQLKVKQEYEQTEKSNSNYNSINNKFGQQSAGDRNIAPTTPPGVGGVHRRKHLKSSILTIVDLAGSERVSQTFSNGKSLEEAQTINKSISALGNCISVLASEMRQKEVPESLFFKPSHIPLRDSKLTRILTDSICGQSQTSIIACISTAKIHYDETYSTLIFATRANSIQIQPQKNEQILIKMIKSRENTDQNNDQSPKIGTTPNKFSKNSLNDSIQGEEINKSNSLEIRKLRDDMNDLQKIYRFGSITNPDNLENNFSSKSLTNFNKSDSKNFKSRDTDIDGYQKREFELVEKFTSIIDHLQLELIKKNKRIEELEMLLYDSKFSDLQ